LDKLCLCGEEYQILIFKEDKINKEEGKILDSEVKKRTKAAMINFGENSKGINAFIVSALMLCCKEFYTSHVQDVKRELEVIEDAIKETSKKIGEQREEMDKAWEDAHRLEKEGKVEEAKREADCMKHLGEEIRKGKANFED
jgi:hypothetical protein